MTTANNSMNIFYLSRLRAERGGEEYDIRSGYLQPQGVGLCLETEWQGQKICFWIMETAWCSWVSPQVIAPSLFEIDADLHALLANWSLILVNDFLKKLDQPICGAVSIYPAPTPQQKGWQIEIQQEDRVLPLFFQQVPDELLECFLSALHPNESNIISLSLSLGWCLVDQMTWRDVKVGDAFLIEGLDEELDTFWVHPPCSPGRITLASPQHAQVTLCATPLLNLPDGTLCIQVEAGQLQISANELANWEEGAELSVQATRYQPGLRLSSQGKLLGLGKLLRFEDGWMVQITARGQS